MDENPASPVAPARVAQEDQYRFPYHYLPVFSDGQFRQHEYWSWGYRYLGRLRVTLDLLQGLSFGSLVDLGCGDGRFLAEVNARFPGKELVGIDSSAKAISLARRMNPGVRYECMDILEELPDAKCDVVTLLEVIEHIPVRSLSRFLSAAVDLLRPGGHLILSVPHVNAKIPEKHFRHFDAKALRGVLPSCLTVIKMFPFDYGSLFLGAIVKLMGGAGRYYIVTHPGLANFVFRYYMDRCLYGEGEGGCRRLACIAQKEMVKDRTSGR
ncbi:MAG: class I SAM-dependent methyltransferase [Thermodesulfobacteriota bacterium]